MATDRIVEIRPKDILVTSRIPAKVTDDDKPVDFYGLSVGLLVNHRGKRTIIIIQKQLLKWIWEMSAVSEPA